MVHMRGILPSQNRNTLPLSPLVSCPSRTLYIATRASGKERERDRSIIGNLNAVNAPHSPSSSCCRLASTSLDFSCSKQPVPRLPQQRTPTPPQIVGYFHSGRSPEAPLNLAVSQLLLVYFAPPCTRSAGVQDAESLGPADAIQRLPAVPYAIRPWQGDRNT